MYTIIITMHNLVFAVVCNKYFTYSFTISYFLSHRELIASQFHVGILVNHIFLLRIFVICIYYNNDFLHLWLLKSYYGFEIRVDCFYYCRFPRITQSRKRIQLWHSDQPTLVLSTVRSMFSVQPKERRKNYSNCHVLLYVWQKM